MESATAFTELGVTRIGLGTNRLTNTPGNQGFLREAIEAGVNFIDTAHLYTGGDSELAIGAALAPFPEGCVVATKGGYKPGEGRPEILRAQIEQSLEHLRTDQIDLYYLHRVDPETPLETSLTVIRAHLDQAVQMRNGSSDHYVFVSLPSGDF